MTPYLRVLLKNRRFHDRNKPNHAERQRKYYAANAESQRESSRKWRANNVDAAFDRRYKEGAYQHLQIQIAQQESYCAICKRPFVKTPDLDHDHDTQQLRGALCRHCNTGIGLLKDSPEILEVAAQYLRDWKGKVNYEQVVSATS